jgi:transcriptional regulator with XRE-family HTH domain
VKTEMEWDDLLKWRRERKMLAGDLAKHLGVSRNTLSRWENGHARLPVDLAGQLERLAYTLAPKGEPAPEPLERVIRGKAFRRSHASWGNENWTSDTEHWSPKPADHDESSVSLQVWESWSDAERQAWRDRWRD